MFGKLLSLPDSYVCDLMKYWVTNIPLKYYITIIDESFSIYYNFKLTMCMKKYHSFVLNTDVL